MGNIPNREQAAAWDGEEGDHWAEHADWYESCADRHWAHVVDTGVLQKESVVLDVGCGTGKSTRDAGRICSSGSALGVDLSSRMLEVGRQRAEAEGLTNVTFVQADAQVHPFDQHGSDVVISDFGAMFFDDPVAAFANIGRALRPGGRLVALAWRELSRNEWLTTIRGALAMGRDLPEPPPEAPTPFSLADPDRVRRILAEAGYESVELDPVDEPLRVGTDAEEAYGVISTVGIVKGLTEELDEGDRKLALEQLRDAFAAHDGPDGVLLGTSAWLITAEVR